MTEITISLVNKSSNYFIYSILYFEKEKFKQKGIMNILIGIVLLLSYIKLFPIIAKFVLDFLTTNTTYQFDTTVLVTFGNYALSVIVFWGLNLMLILFYYFRFSCIEIFKVTKTEWPWIYDKKSWKILFYSTIKFLLINQVLISFTLITLVYYYIESFTNLDLNYIPGSLEFSTQILFCMICYDVTFHITHRALHEISFLYKNIHNVHHEYNCPIGVSAIYAHPLEYVFGNVLPGVVGPWLLGNNMHLITFFGWTCWGLSSTIEQHCGYDFPFLPFSIIPFSFGARYHDFHHSRYGYNYSSNFTYLDSIGKTNKVYLEYLEKRNNIE